MTSWDESKTYTASLEEESDEYVFAGGIRQSEVVEKQQATRKENQKTEEEKKRKE